MSKLACVRGDTPLTHALGLLLEAGVSCLPVVDANGVLLDIYARADITMLAKVGRGRGVEEWRRCGVEEGRLVAAWRRGAAWARTAGLVGPPAEAAEARQRRRAPGLVPSPAADAAPPPPPPPQSNAYARLQFEDVTVGQALALAGQALPPPQLAAGAGGGAPPPQWGGSPRGSASSLGADPGSQPPPGSKQHRLHVCTPHDALRTVVERLSVPGVRRLVVVDGESRRVEGIVSLSDVAAFLLL